MRTRGASMIEVLLASTIFIFGSLGTTTLLIQGSLSQRRGTQPVIAQLSAQQLLADYTLSGYSGLTAGTFDGGVDYDGSGRAYTRTVTVDPDAGFSYPAYLVTVRVESIRPGFPTPLVSTASTIVSVQPDGG
jgi:Tfp pilus assembly protein PilV